jgi:MFS family permease
MLRGARDRLAESLGAFRDVFRNPNLRRLQLAFAGSIIGSYSYSIVIAVYAFQHGGAAAVGIVGVLRTIPPALVGPFTATLADRHSRKQVMLVSNLLRVVVLAVITAIVFAGGPAPVVYALVSLATLIATPFRPAEAALMPAVARTPEELTAANVSSSTIESLGDFVGPAIGGIVYAVAGAGPAFGITVLTVLWSALLISRLDADVAPSRPEDEPTSFRRDASLGFRTIALEPRLRVIVVLYCAQTVVAGALGVLVVVTALDLLDVGKAGLGVLNSASGIGGLVGAAAALLLVGRKRLASDFGVGIVLWGLPLLVIGLFPNPIVALLMLGVLGAGNTIVDVAALTLLQRTVSDEVLARVFGVMEGLLVATMGLGAILAPLLISAFGVRAALIVTGGFLPVLAALLWRKLTSVDAVVPERELALLQGIPFFELLPAHQLEPLARKLAPLRLGAGTEIFRLGDRGDRFYVIASGEVDVDTGGERKTLGPGESFGEIALLRDVPRTATVTALTDVELYGLDSDEFIGGVTGHAPSREAADAVIGARLGNLRSGIAAV